MQRQEELIRAAVRARGGRVFKVVGDGLCAAFPAAGDALRAAVEAQLSLHGADWGPTPLRARMALHVGEAEAAGDDYAGPALNRVARVLAAAHGGQILLSSAAAELVREALPAGAALLDLGDHDLPGLRKPQRLLQLVHPDLPSRFPPVRASSRSRHDLPASSGTLVGRDAELAEIRRLLGRPDVRLLTLTGTGGAGKTRLALAAATELAASYADGVVLVELAALSDATLVIPAVAHALGLGDRGSRGAAEELEEWLRRRQVLLVLDNFEQVLQAAAGVARLLAACPRVQVLATSRAPLRVSFERELPVEPLETPDPARLPPLEELARVPAVTLFVQRAAGVRPSFALTPENAADVATVCSRLDGLPLAIELAAARTRLLPTNELRRRLGRSLDLLAGGARDRPPRHQTLRQAIDWSFALLEPGLQRLMNRLSVFVGGFTPDAAEAVCGSGPDGGDVLDRLAALLDMSLLRRPRQDEVRLTLLETIREYAREGLEASGEDPRPDHARWYLELAERAERELRGPEQGAWLRRVDADHENLRAALRWALDAGEAEVGLRIASGLWRYWELRGYVSEGRRWLDEALAAPGAAELDPGLRARALCNAASLAKRQGDLTVAEALLAEAVSLARAAADRWALAAALNLQGMVAYERLDLEHAKARYAESLALFRELGDTRAEAYVLGNAGLTEAAADPRRAVAVLRDALDLFRGLGDPRGLAGVLNNLGDALERAGQREEARAAHEESLAIKRELGSQHGIADSLANLASLALDAGDSERAQKLYHEALALYAESDVPRGTAHCLAGLAALALGRGDAGRAARLLGRMERLCADRGLVLPGNERLRRTESAVRRALGEAAYGEARRRGAGLPMTKVLEDAPASRRR